VILRYVVLISLHDELTEILRSLNSSIKYEWEEELYAGGGEWGEFLGEDWFLEGDVLGKDWFLGGGDEKFGDDEGFEDEEFSLGGVRGEGI